MSSPLKWICSFLFFSFGARCEVNLNAFHHSKLLRSQRNAKLVYFWQHHEFAANTQHMIYRLVHAQNDVILHNLHNLSVFHTREWVRLKFFVFDRILASSCQFSLSGVFHGELILLNGTRTQTINICILLIVCRLTKGNVQKCLICHRILKTTPWSITTDASLKFLFH